ncbi:RNA methyltransferase [Gordonia sp. zg691]|uniref:RNA methyltransferase n=1 Tax=Gordonia jinghuaiqii TaxID=2758710 RepID=A0A7D7LPC7_9ACTN|nr:RNA methyltransferase [Gordonia jinghuaiqii]MBD0860257.1 RNA methyltransferase [Gordonia jinghuaiqii]MCR5977423.1 RNA methyltransferase [Gordonia jinghuaiqii]QMT00005.1 RNA methyltransferase [Gordonia jinghuaiqii]
MTEILSERSSRVVSYAKLRRAAERRDQGRFLAEGANAVSSALAVGRAETVLVSDDDQPRHRELLDTAAAAGVPVLVVSARAASKLAETSTPPGIFAVCPLLDVPLDAVLAAQPRLLAIAVEAREPGNAGTLIRCADAMGADAVVLLGDAVDPHNGKCVRASAGSVFTVPVVRHRALTDGLDAIRRAGIALLATAADGEVVLDHAADVLAGRVGWLFGNEAHGLSADIQRFADHRVSIPIRGRAESLNVAAAAAICLYESARIHSAAGRD